MPLKVEKIINQDVLDQLKSIGANSDSKPKKKESFSTRELMELMGTNRPKYYRNKGSFRSR